MVSSARESLLHPSVLHFHQIKYAKNSYGKIPGYIF